MSAPGALCLLGLAAVLTLALFVNWHEWTTQIGCPYCGAPQPYERGSMRCPECGQVYER